MRRYIVSVACGLLLLGARGTAVQPYTFTTLEIPCAACSGGIAPRSQPNGINARGDVVGGFSDAVGGAHGFLLRDGQVTTIDVPGSLIGVSGTLPTSANGVSASGDIVGQFTARYNPPISTSVSFDDPRYCPAAGSPACVKGFVYQHGVFSALLFPGHPGAIPWHVGPDGSVYGCLHDFDFMASMVGAIWSRSGNTSLTAGGGELADPTLSFPSSMNNGASGNGLIVGLWDDTNTPSHRHGLLVQNGEPRSYDFPSATVSLTAIWDVNVSGQFVGTYVDATGRHGFLQNPDGAAAIQLDDSDGANTVVNGINPEGVIVGTYTAGGKIHGFVGIPATD